MKVISLSVCAALLLAACGGAESDSKRAVLGRLKDPDSAKFGKFTQVNGKHACLTVNARNSMGGYTGDQQARLIKHDKGWEVVVIDEMPGHEYCVDMIKSISEPKRPN